MHFTPGAPFMQLGGHERVWEEGENNKWDQHSKELEAIHQGLTSLIPTIDAKKNINSGLVVR